MRHYCKSRKSLRFHFEARFSCRFQVSEVLAIGRPRGDSKHDFSKNLNCSRMYRTISCFLIDFIGFPYCLKGICKGRPSNSLQSAFTICWNPLEFIGFPYCLKGICTGRPSSSLQIAFTICWNPLEFIGFPYLFKGFYNGRPCNLSNCLYNLLKSCGFHWVLVFFRTLLAMEHLLMQFDWAFNDCSFSGLRQDLILSGMSR